MFNNVGWGELAVLLVVGLFVFGPERLPKAAADAARMLRQLRKLATGFSEDIKAELGPEVGNLDLASLHPRRFVEKHLFSDDDEEPLRAPALRAGQQPLPAGERAPYDPDAT